MSDEAKLVFVKIYEEYQNRLKQGMDKGCTAFNKDKFFAKFSYSNDEIETILDELKYHGLIEKWITGDFAVKID